MNTKLRNYLKNRGISQRWFAKAIGTTPNNLSLIISGKSTPSLRLAHEIEKQTGGMVTMYDWVKDEPEKNPTE